jgi:hypothetical protein
MPFSIPLGSPLLKTADETFRSDAPDGELIWVPGPYIDHGRVAPPAGTEVFSIVRSTVLCLTITLSYTLIRRPLDLNLKVSAPLNFAPPAHLICPSSIPSKLFGE